MLHRGILCEPNKCVRPTCVSSMICVRWHSQHSIRLKPSLNPVITKLLLSKTYFAIVPLFWYSAQSMAAMLSYSVQHFETIGQLKWMLWPNAISRDFNVRYVLDEYPRLHSSPDCSETPSISPSWDIDCLITILNVIWWSARNNVGHYLINLVMCLTFAYFRLWGYHLLS